MNIRNAVVWIFIFLLVACKAKQEEQNLVIESQVEALITNDDKRLFLEKILEEDQSVRDSQKDAELVMKYGRDSKEVLDYTKQQWRQDEINLIKVEFYLNKFGYPSKVSLGEESATAPWLVIHHTSDVDVRNKYFKELFRAYLNENIDDTQLAFYLGRTYSFINREDFYIESPFKAEDELNGLIEALGLDEEKLSVLQDFQRK